LDGFHRTDGPSRRPFPLAERRAALLIGRKHMRFVLVNGRTPRSQSLCAMCCEPIGENYLREIATQLSYCCHECYRGRWKQTIPALQYHARAS
jgi:hypothetical protein